MSDHEDRGQFVSGGYNPTPPPPPNLPSISDVKPGTVYQTPDGTLWKACKGELFSPPKWDWALIVTPQEHRAVIRRSVLLLGVWLLLILAAWIPTRFDFLVGTFLIIAVWFVVGAVLVRTDSTRRAHVVTPEMADISAQSD